MTTITGKVTVRGDRIAAMVVAELLNASGDVVDQVKVDTEGTYRYHLSPGRWTLNLWDAHGHRGLAEVVVEEGEDKIVNIDLKGRETHK